MLEIFFQQKLETAPSKEDLFTEMQRMLQVSPHNISAVFMPLYSEGQIPAASHFKRYKGKRYEVEQKDFQDFSVLKLQKEVVYAGESRVVEGFIATYKDEGHQYLFSASTDVAMAHDFGDFLEHNVYRWLECFYPFLSVVTFSGTDMLDFITSLEDGSRSVQIISSGLAFVPGSQTTRVPETLRKVKQRLKNEKGAALERVTFKLLPEKYSDSPMDYCITVLRDGSIYYHEGRIDRFREDISRLLDKSTANVQKLKGIVGQRESSVRKFTGLKLFFKNLDMLSEIERGEAFVEALESDRVNVVTLLHGNPYVHIVVTDMVDGSSFSIYSADVNEVKIVPGSYSTKASLNRLLGTIRRKFAEPTGQEEYSVTV